MLFLIGVIAFLVGGAIVLWVLKKLKG